MIHFDPPPEPEDFDKKARQPGNAWLAEHPDATRPRDFWRRFKAPLADGFRDLCAYSAMYEPVGTVDHYESITTHPLLAYEWSNYRFAAQWVNSSKRDAKVLDPFDVADGWFEILLPSLQLVVTERVPAEHRALAEYTLHRLHLRDDERVIRQRREWYRLYQKTRDLDVLRRYAPLIARAVEKQDAQAE
jgi:hypothetical protein